MKGVFLLPEKSWVKVGFPVSSVEAVLSGVGSSTSGRLEPLALKTLFLLEGRAFSAVPSGNAPLYK